MKTSALSMLAVSVVATFGPFAVVEAGETQDARYFDDATATAGLEGKPGAFPAWCDFDADGKPDLFAGGRLYRNGGPPSYRFDDITDAAFGSSPGGNGIWADMDNNGLPDLVVPGPDNADGAVIGKVWFNRKGKFEALPVRAGEAKPDCRFVATVGAGDADLDGFADLLFVCGEDWNDGKPRYFGCFFMKNLKGKGFADATADAGFAQYPARYARGVAFGDYNNDGLPDAYVSNYRLDDNALWENAGGGRFANVAGDRGVRGVARENGGRAWYGHTIGSAWGDLDNDGDLDLWTSNLVHKDGKLGYHRGLICDDSKVYFNLGAPDFRFEDRRDKAGIATIPLDSVGKKADGSGAIVDELWAGVCLGDFDNDGFLDAFVPQVYDLPWAFAHFYRNAGGGRFVQRARESGIEIYDTYSGAAADFDCDGKLDIAAWGRPKVGEKPRLFLFRNRWGSPPALSVRLAAAESNGSALGARATLRSDSGLMIREQEGATSSHCQQNSPVLHFGLGDRKPSSLEVRWPNGRIQFVKPPATGEVKVTEPRGSFPAVTRIRLDPSEPKAGEEVNITAEVKMPPGGSILRVEWDFESDCAFDETTTKPSTARKFDAPGKRLVRVRVHDRKSGCAAEGLVLVDVKG